MATQTPQASRAPIEAAAITGLDSLEPAHRHEASAWQARPDGLGGDLAEAARCRPRPRPWQLVVSHRLEDSTRYQGPDGSSRQPVAPDASRQLLWQAIGITLRRAAWVRAGDADRLGARGVRVEDPAAARGESGSIITGLQTMPSIAWFPFAIILFGSPRAAILFVMVLGAAPSIANGLITGVDYTPPLLLSAGKTMGLRGFDRYRYLILPASLPAYVAGLKQGWAFAWRSLMAGELLVLIIGQPSIGLLATTTRTWTSSPARSSIMIVILVIGIGVDTLFSKADAVRRRRGLTDPASA